ncbi:MAG: AAA family ATPase [Lachnospiraceae bacterium]|nr:AAA family ATPase [Lachnospiraceae bacterium]
MSRGDIYFFSGPCGCGKSTLANAFAKHLVNEAGKKQVYLIHGDDFHGGFVESDNKEAFFKDGQASDALLWADILKFNWDCILTVARKVLEKGLDVVIDYVIEDELPLVQALAKEFDAKLYYVVLTASCDTIEGRIRQRGDVEMVERALFLKNKLDNLPENQGHLFDNTDKTVEQEVELLAMEIQRYIRG